VSLYANGKKIREATIKEPNGKGVKWRGSWTIKTSGQDVFLVVIAEGPGRSTSFWQIPKPYQRSSPEWSPKIIGASGAIWIDGDKDGKRTSAIDYANKVITSSANNLNKIIAGLARYDEAVSVQAAAILYKKGILVSSEKLLKQASPVVQRGFIAFTNELPKAF
jgi:hypothetical protein